jgi:hypothetical protein
MTFLDVRPAGIPVELRAWGAWVLWRAEPRPGDKPAKVPYQSADPDSRASSTDRRTWSTFDEALEAYYWRDSTPHPTRGPIAGIGVILTTDAGLVCIDLDRVIDAAGRLDDRARRIVEHCASWTERSPSGTGLHIFGRGTVPAAIKGDQIEVYGHARYIAVTGHQWPGTPATLREIQPYLDRLVLADRADRAAPHPPWTGPAPPPPDDLVGALLAKLHTWGLAGTRIKPWQSGYLVDLDRCPWASTHTTGPGGAAVLIHASGAFDFTCLHAHCAGRTWRDFRAVMERQS